MIPIIVHQNLQTKHRLVIFCRYANNRIKLFDAILDRLTGNAHRFELKGKSLRKKQAFNINTCTQYSVLSLVLLGPESVVLLRRNKQDIARGQIDRFVYRNGAIGGVVGRNIAGLRYA